ncbi:hypothetical protein ACFLIM_40775 [Nonomuraea sp. M3C6]|uniref:Uncharacterized protein n=1 Tax=Nonomuraea marmarensis TaxID=3351344 RepID=A0ABW7ATL6_9ACTN
MISLGMAVAGRADLTFYTELRPISDEFVPAALAVSGLDRDRLLREAPAPEEAMAAAARWVDGLRKIGRPVFLAAPAVWDGMFVHWYFIRFTGKSPFGATGSGVFEAVLRLSILTRSSEFAEKPLRMPGEV